jgi:kynurenine formamidase
MGDGFFAEVFTHVGQWGTHVDPPAHFHKGLRTVDQIDLKEMILSLVCVVPESGAIVVVSFPKPKDGSGFLASVFAILP